MGTKRPYYRYKWQWAQAQSERLRKAALDLPGGIARSRQRANAETAARYYREAHRYERLAERYKAAGV